MLFVVSTIAIWGLALTILPSWWRTWRERQRRPREAACRKWCVLTTLCLAACFTLLQPPVYSRVYSE